MGFILGLEEKEVVLNVKQCGETHKLRHVIRRPSEKESLAYDKKCYTTKGRGRKIKPVSHVQEATIAFYNSLVIRTEGYQEMVKGKPVELDQSIGDWREKIPYNHKMTVIDAFDDIEDEEEEKNVISG